jgi:ATP-dependent RNA helicase SUPV3L1/SUV3
MSTLPKPDMKPNTRLIAVLGPTNTGKTHLAIERLLGHRTAMIGFPLRLLARENYDRVVKIKGAKSVALLTGEEKIIPPGATHFICTVESMPLDRRVDFLAIDEVQLAADPERGHVFTDRILRARGESETMFLGAETIKPLLRRLVPGLEFVSRPRFSQLSYAGAKKLVRLPRRSAVVAFSAGEVYGLAELIRRQRGGAAVVLGALSPRTRNAQVGLYQSGEVDYLVATDAIGMGLNMDVDHVAFASMRKFDGRNPRDLSAAELAQIAGRAGRHMNDGTFGATADLLGIDPDLTAAVEAHAFPHLKTLMWRNSELRFVSVATLLADLAKPPAFSGLMRARMADDHAALQALAADAEMMALVQAPARVRLLWEVCQIPDFRKVGAEIHSRLLRQIFMRLAENGGLSDDWLDGQVKRLERSDGDIDTLSARIAHIRTWTYVSHHSDWVGDAKHWQERTRAIEDMLSDALHQRLTQRFIDRRTSVLMRKLSAGDDLKSEVDENDAVAVDGHFVGHLRGFHFHPEKGGGGASERAAGAAGLKTLGREVEKRLSRLEEAGDEHFAILPDGGILWREALVGRLVKGGSPLAPLVEIASGELLASPAASRLRARLEKLRDAWLSRHFSPLLKLSQAELGGPARGLVFQLIEHLGSLDRPAAEGLLASVPDAERKTFTHNGTRFGSQTIFFPALLKPLAIEARAILWRVFSGREAPLIPPRPAAMAEKSWSDKDCLALGYRKLGSIVIRADILERFAFEARNLARQGPFIPNPFMRTLLGLKPEGLAEALKGLGYREKEGLYEKAKPQRPRREKPVSASPFAALKEHFAGRK